MTVRMLAKYADAVLIAAKEARGYPSRDRKGYSYGQSAAG